MEPDLSPFRVPIVYQQKEWSLHFVLYTGRCLLLDSIEMSITAPTTEWGVVETKCI